MMKKKIILGVLMMLLLLSASLLHGASYIDYQIKRDDVYANVVNEIFNEEIVWKYKVKMSASANTGSYTSLETITHTAEFGPGLWYFLAETVVKSGKCLDNADNLYVFLEAWEDDNYNTNFDSVDDDYRSDTDYDSNISGNARNVWTNFNSNDNSGNYANAGAVGDSDGDYRIEFISWWNWSLPVNPAFSLPNVTSEGFKIDFGSTNNYRVTSWSYQVSTTSNFSNIVKTGSVTADTQVAGLAENTTYYVRISGANERGSGVYTTYQSVQTSFTAPVAATNVFPLNNSTNTPRQVTVNWSYSGGNIPTHFKVIQNDNQVGSDIPYTTNKLYHKQLNEVAYGSAVSWKVIPYSEVGDCLSPVTWSFTVRSEPEAGEVEPSEVVYTEVENITIVSPEPIVLPSIDLGDGSGEREPSFDFEYDSVPNIPLLTIQVYDAPPVNVVPNQQNCAISFIVTYPTGIQTTLALNYGGIHQATQLWHFNGGEWQDISGIATFDVGIVTFPFTVNSRGDEEFVINNGEGTLPVELSSFTANYMTNDFVSLRWTTHSESNLLGYNVYKGSTSDLEQASNITNPVIPASNTASGNDYSYIDNEIESGNTYYYWLQSIELDGTSDFYVGGSVTIEQDDNAPSLDPLLITKLLGAYPNPFNPSTNINFTLAKPTTVDIKVYDLRGRVVKTFAPKLYGEGNNSVVWNASGASSGMYLIKMQAGKKIMVEKAILLK